MSDIVAKKQTSVPGIFGQRQVSCITDIMAMCPWLV